MVRMLGRKILRVPLYAQRKAVRAFHRLHKAVRGKTLRKARISSLLYHRVVTTLLIFGIIIASFSSPADFDAAVIRTDSLGI